MPETPNEWLVNQVRLTLFPTPMPAVIDGAGWWEELTGSRPETIVENPKMATREVQGEFSGVTLTLQINPLRIDWLLGAGPRALDGLADPSATAGPWIATLGVFAGLMEKWLVSAEWPPIVRLGFGVTISLRVPSREAGYELLGTLLKAVQLDAATSSDFSYQINRPRVSQALPTTKINRLSKWVVGAQQAFVASPSGMAMGAREHFVRVELDINTAPETLEALPKAKVPELLHELLSLAKEIVANGEIP